MVSRANLAVEGSIFISYRHYSDERKNVFHTAKLFFTAKFLGYQVGTKKSFVLGELVALDKFDGVVYDDASLAENIIKQHLTSLAGSVITEVKNDYVRLRPLGETSREKYERKNGASPNFWWGAIGVDISNITVLSPPPETQPILNISDFGSVKFKSETYGLVHPDVACINETEFKFANELEFVSFFIRISTLTFFNGHKYVIFRHVAFRDGKYQYDKDTKNAVVIYDTTVPGSREIIETHCKTRHITVSFYETQETLFETTRYGIAFLEVAQDSQASQFIGS